MGTAATPPAQVEQARQDNDSAEQALVPATQAREAATLIPPSDVVARLPVQVDVAVPLQGFRVRNLLALAPGALIESEWEQGEDVPLASGDVQLAWSEFEVIDAQLAVRLTRLS